MEHGAPLPISYSAIKYIVTPYSVDFGLHIKDYRKRREMNERMNERAKLTLFLFMAAQHNFEIFTVKKCSLSVRF